MVDRLLNTLKLRNVSFLKRLYEENEGLVASDTTTRDKVYFALRVQARKGDNGVHVANVESQTVNHLHKALLKCGLYRNHVRALRFIFSRCLVHDELAAIHPSGAYE